MININVNELKRRENQHIWGTLYKSFKRYSEKKSISENRMKYLEKLLWIRQVSDKSEKTESTSKNKKQAQGQSSKRP